MSAPFAEHLRYNKIASSLTTAHPAARGRNSNKRDDHGRLWCVTEKVHGANLSVYVSRKGEIRFAKRSGFLRDDEEFFGHHEALGRHRPSIISISEEVFAKYSDVSCVILFGEIFGGSYPGVMSAPGTRAVQVGVHYSPSIEFMIFDICINRDGLSQYLPFCETIEMAEKYDIFCATPLHVGSLTSCVGFNHSFSSTIPARLGFPSPPNGCSNIAEGIVIRSFSTPYTCGQEDEREIFKIKNAEFSEGEGCPPPQRDDIAYLRDWVLSLVNPNRIASATSKVGSLFERSNWTAIVDEVVSDVGTECGADSSFSPEMWSALRAICRHKAHNILVELAA